MDSRERLRRCYFHEELDRPAVFVRTGYPSDDRSYSRARSYIEAHTDLKTSWGLSSLLAEPPSQSYREPHNQDWERKVEVYQTPKGELRRTFLHSLRGLPGMQEKHLLESRRDAEKYLSIPLPKLSDDVSSFFEKRDKVGNRGIVEATVGMNPAGTVAELFGSESFAMMTVTDRDVLHALCEHRMKHLLHLLKQAISLGAGPFFAMAGEEFLVPPLHGPADFNDFNVKYDKPIADLIHDAGGRLHVHSHGSIKKVFQGFLEIGVDVLHPFEAPPMGDITAAEAKAMAGQKMTLEGNLQIAHMYESTLADIREQTRALIRDCFADRQGLIVCPTASPYQRGKGEECYENFKAMIDAVLEWRA